VQHSKPTAYKAKRGAGKAPEASLRLRRAHGFRCHDTRGNLKYTSDGKIVYTTAALGVVQDKAATYNTAKTEKIVVQDFFDLHQDDIVALAIHPNRNIVATGQMAAQGKAKMVDVFVWDVAS
jgi:microtubule-associated protein-like 6